MTDKHYEIEFDGYWREPNKNGLPAESGIYCAYTCVHDTAKNTVSLKKLVYVGEAGDVRQRVATHSKWDAWRSHLETGEQICLSMARVASTARERVEAALIFHHRPPENDEYKSSFPFDRTTVRTSGKNALLADHFTVPGGT